MTLALDPWRLAALFAGLACLLCLAGCGTSAISSSGPGTITSAGISLRPPAGWAFQSLSGPGGVATAPAADDLTAAAPGGPRLIAEPATAVAGDPASIVKDSGPASSVGSVTVTDGLVGKSRYSAVVATWTESMSGRQVTTELAVASVGRSRSVRFRLQAPSDQWSGVSAELEGILATVEIDPAAIPPAL